MTTLKDLEKQIKKQTKVLNKAKAIAKESYNNGQNDMVSKAMEHIIAEDILMALESTLEKVREHEAERILPHNNL